MSDLLHEAIQHRRLDVVEGGKLPATPPDPTVVLVANSDAFFDISVEPRTFYRLYLSSSERDRSTPGPLLVIVSLPDEMVPTFECAGPALRLLGGIGLFPTVEQGSTTFWFRTGDTIVPHLRIRLRSWGGPRIAVADRVYVAAPASPSLSAAAPAFDTPLELGLVPLDGLSGYTARLPVAAGRQYLFIASAAGPAGSPLHGLDGEQPVCEIEFFEADDVTGHRGPRCARYLLPLSAPLPEVCFETFMVQAPRHCVSGAARFLTPAGYAGSMRVASRLWLVPAASLTYGSTLQDDDCRFCPLPVVGPLRSALRVSEGEIYEIVAEFDVPGTVEDEGLDSQGTAVFIPITGADLDVDGQANLARMPLRDGRAAFRFRATSRLARIDVEFFGLPQGALLRRPLEAVRVVPRNEQPEVDSADWVRRGTNYLLLINELKRVCTSLFARIRVLEEAGALPRVPSPLSPEHPFFKLTGLGAENVPETSQFDSIMRMLREIEKRAAGAGDAVLAERLVHRLREEAAPEPASADFGAEDAAEPGETPTQP